MDVILYRYQLRMLKQKVNAHKCVSLLPLHGELCHDHQGHELDALPHSRCGLDQAAKTVAHMARKPSSGSYESYLSAQVDYLDSCLPEVASHIPSGPNYAAPSYYR